MGLFFALFLGIFVVTNVNNLPENSQQEEKITQVNTNKTVENKPLISEVKPQPKEPEPIKEEVTETVNLDEPATDWLQIFLLALGVIFVIGSGTYFYTRIKNNSSSGHSNDYMRREFKEKTESETTDQQPDQAETTEQQLDQAETTEQQPDQAETTEQQPDQAETTEQQPDQAETTEQQPDQAETTEQQPDQAETTEEDENNNK